MRTPATLLSLTLLALATVGAHPTDAQYESNQISVSANSGIVTVAHSNADFTCTHSITADLLTPETTVDVACTPALLVQTSVLHSACLGAGTAVAGYGVAVGTDGTVTIGSDSKILPSITVSGTPTTSTASGFIEATGGCDDYDSHTSAVAPSASSDHVNAYSDLTTQTCTVLVTGQLALADWGAACWID